MKVKDLNEALTSEMKLRLEMSKVREDQEETRSMVTELAGEVGRLKKVIATLVKKLGPQ